MAQFDTDEIIEVRAGRLTRLYKGYKGTFASMIYNCIHKRSLPGLPYERDIIVDTKTEQNVLSVTFSGKHTDKALMDIMDVALENSSAFAVETGKADFSINVR